LAQTEEQRHWGHGIRISLEIKEIENIACGNLYIKTFCMQTDIFGEKCMYISIWCILESDSIGKKIANYTYAQTTR